MRRDDGPAGGATGGEPPTPALAAAVMPRAVQDTAAADGAVLDTVLSTEGVPALLRAALIVALGLPTVVVGSRLLGRWASERYSPQQGMVARKLVLYPGVAVVAIWVLGQLGFSLAPLLGAAGIVGIALGFASQTSVSNVISGLFLIAEQPFEVGDVIQVGTTMGRVQSVDMLSVKLRTFDNRFVRIPNESLIKSDVTNITRFEIRRLDVPVGVAYREDVERVRAVLLEIADQNPRCLIDPAPMVRFEGFGESSVNLTLAVWTRVEGWIDFKNAIQEEIKARLDAEGIEIPFPHRTLYTGSVTDPFPVRILQDEGGPAGPGADEGGSRPVGGGDPADPSRDD